LSPEVALDVGRTYALIHEGACALRISRDVVVVHGEDARRWLQGQVSQDIEALGIGQSAETLVLAPQGKVEAYCRATLLSDDLVLLDTEAGHGEGLFERLRRFRLRVKAELEFATVSCLRVLGPDSAASLARSGLQTGGVNASAPLASAPLSEGWILAVPVTWPGYAGFDVLTPADATRNHGVDAPEGDAGACEAARIEAGVPAMGRELTDKTIPQEAGSLVEHTVSFTKGCYTGQELVARLDARGGKVARHLRGVVLDAAGRPGHPGEHGDPQHGDPGEHGDPQHGDPGEHGEDSVLVSGDREIGRLTSMAWSPGFEALVALAYVRRDVAPPARATVIPGGAGAEIRELPLSIG